MPSRGYESMDEVVLSEGAGVVLDAIGNRLRVRLPGHNVIVHFPRGMISEDLALPGTEVTYQVVRRANGESYPRFVSRQAELDQERVDEVLDELSKIRYRETR
jgi:hypothetical protein